jgi:hypothetical protein
MRKNFENEVLDNLKLKKKVFCALVKWKRGGGGDVEVACGADGNVKKMYTNPQTWKWFLKRPA